MSEEAKQKKEGVKPWGRLFSLIGKLGVDKNKMHAYLKKVYKTDHLSTLPVDKLDQIIKRLEEIEGDDFELEILKSKIEKEDANNGNVDKVDKGTTEENNGK